MSLKIDSKSCFPLSFLFIKTSLRRAVWYIDGICIGTCYNFHTTFPDIAPPLLHLFFWLPPPAARLFRTFRVIHYPSLGREKQRTSPQPPIRPTLPGTDMPCIQTLRNIVDVTFIFREMMCLNITFCRS